MSKRCQVRSWVISVPTNCRLYSLRSSSGVITDQTRKSNRSLDGLCHPRDKSSAKNHPGQSINSVTAEKPSQMSQKHLENPLGNRDRHRMFRCKYIWEIDEIIHFAPKYFEKSRKTHFCSPIGMCGSVIKFLANC